MTTCPVCGGAAARDVRRVGEYTVRECEHCGLHWSDPMRPATAEWYAGEASYEDALGATAAAKLRHVYADRLEDDLSPAEWLGPNHLAFLAALPHRGGALLDIGCGEGTFLAAAERHYSTVAGIELDPNAVERAQHRLGDRVRALTVEEIEDDATYDVVTMFEVLEHVGDPMGALRASARLLRPGGMLVVSVPNRARPGADEDDTDWPPNHLTRWTRTALGEALKATGFAADYIHSAKHSRYGYWEAAWMFGARFPSVFSRAAGRSTRRWLMLRRLSALLWFPFWPVYAATRRSTYGLYAVARR